MARGGASGTGRRVAGDARVRRVRAGDWRSHQTRARETLRAALRSAEAAEWSAVAAIAPVCIVSAAQALVAWRANVVARPDDYNTAIELLAIHGAGLPALEDALESLRHVLERKIAVQHGAEPATEPVARDILEHTARFVEWVERQLGTAT